MAMYCIAYASLLDIILNPFYDLIITIIGVILGELAYSFLYDIMKKPKIEIEPISQVGYIFGFSISMIRKSVLNAQVLCNNKSCNWEEGDIKIQKKDLFAGANPSFVFPFQAFVEETSEGIIVSIKERTTEKTIYKESFHIEAPPPIHEGHQWKLTSMKFEANSKKPSFNVSLRIIGQGIEEKRDFVENVFFDVLHMPLTKDGKPDLEKCILLFNLKQKKKHLFF